MEHWHSLSEQEVLRRQDSSHRGLTFKQAGERLAQYGPNQLPQPPRPGLLRRVLGQLRDPMILVLLGAAGLSLAAGGGREWLDSVIILVIVVVNSVLSITQEDHAQQALSELQEMSAPRARVRRAGEERQIPAREVVPGDVLVLSAGDRVAADARILTCHGLRVDESAMTGESVPVEKAAGEPLDEDTPLADRSNMVLSGTHVTAGRATAVVVATGADSRMGAIARLLLEEEGVESPLQKKMAEISKILSFLCLCVCAVMFGVGLLRGKGRLEMFLTAVSLAVAAIPEGLPAIVTIVLALGVQRMARKGSILKTLPAVETLGCAGVICSDKTGTLTQNRMAVQRLWLPHPSAREEALRCAALCSEARVERGEMTGDPTECALARAALEEGLERGELERELPRVEELSFDSRRKRMATVHKKPGGGWVVYVKGAPDVLLQRCAATPTGPLDEAGRAAILRANEEMASRALRVIACAKRELSLLPGDRAGALENELTFLGLFGLMDPPRPEVKRAVERCRRAGVQPVMITGDHRSTAQAVARELGILQPGKWTLTGTELDFMPQQVLEEEIARCAVFARVTPEHKVRIVQAWQKRGMVVAMTGDGVNDAPALRRADIGCAMGRSGTDVARGAADMILTDDDFSTIVSAVEEGRGIYANIRKAIHYLLSCNIGEVVTVFLATLLDLGQMPLKPVQLLWLNLVTDSLPALALGLEPVEPGVMERPPRAAGAALFDRAFSLRLGWQGMLVGGLTLLAYFRGLTRLGGPEVANTMAFATLTLSQLVHAWNVRSESRSLFARGGAKNPAMGQAFLIGLGLQLAVLCVPVLQGVFGVVPMTAQQWLWVAGLSLAPVPVCEGEKWLRRGKAGE